MKAFLKNIKENLSAGQIITGFILFAATAFGVYGLIAWTIPYFVH